ncbi:PQQ-binding-like beta-propeller repeat protein [Verrucomicrobiota bacterium]
MVARKLVVSAAVVAALTSTFTRAADWPQWRGPNRNGISAESGWTAKWSEQPPSVPWRAEVGAGYPAVAVVGDRVYTSGNFEGFVKVKDTVFCLDAATGKKVWEYSYSSAKGTFPGPRATPTIDGDLLFTLGRHGDFICLKTKDGALAWKTDVRKEHGVKAEAKEWGLSCSPLIVGKDVILDLGKVLAFDKTTGKLKFSMGDDVPAFSSPVLVQTGGKHYITSLNAFGLVVYDLATRKAAGRQAWDAKWAATSVTPIVSGDLLFVAAGYGRGCGLFRLKADRLEPVYKNTDMNNESSTCVLYEGHLYGVSGDLGKKGHLKCVEFATGKVKWKGPELKVGGGLMIAGDKIIHMEGDGQIVILEAAADACRELSRAKVLKGRCWTVPVLANGRVYCRNTKGSMVCLDVRKK